MPVERNEGQRFKRECFEAEHGKEHSNNSFPHNSSISLLMIIVLLASFLVELILVVQVFVLFDCLTFYLFYKFFIIKDFPQRLQY